MATQETVGSRTTTTARRPGNWLWAALAIGALVLLGLGAWMWSSGGGDDQPTLTFDGTVATYEGPDTIEAGQVTFRLENDSDRDVVFVWGRHHEDVDITEEEQRAWMEENPYGSAPPWIENGGDIGPAVPAGTTAEQTAELAPGVTDLLAFDEIAYGATTIQVAEGS